MKKDLLTLFDIDAHELDELFVLADALKKSDTIRPLEGKHIAMIFQKPSLRTRVSFEVGIAQLGGTTTMLSQESIGIGVREPVRDVAKVLSRYCSAIIARLFDHAVLEELARHATVPIINALTDKSHPCEVLSDLYTLRQHKRLQKGVKVVFVGDGNNVANSWLEAAACFPLHFVFAAPSGYWPDNAVVDRARGAGMSSIDIVEDPMAAARGADVLYTDVWTSMGQEAETDKRKRAFAHYQINERLMKEAKKECLVMHCLPAHRGEEITGDILDGPNSVVFDQAENRLHAQKAVLAKVLRNHLT